ncbi:MAG: phosphorylase, partial [Gammaproteobacteria bacterium]|nr:phosphorylase [Gammaproteobacteria bacterium]
ITRAARPQTELLDASDFEASLLALAGSDGLVFYNGGAEAGASQAHKHLQHVPLPLAPGVAPLPFAPVLQRSALGEGIGRSGELPFAHALAPVPRAWWHAPHAHARTALKTWRDLWRALGHEIPESGEQPRPYNLLLTRGWMW